MRTTPNLLLPVYPTHKLPPCHYVPAPKAGGGPLIDRMPHQPAEAQINHPLGDILDSLGAYPPFLQSTSPLHCHASASDSNREFLLDQKPCCPPEFQVGCLPMELSLSLFPFTHYSQYPTCPHHHVPYPNSVGEPLID